MVLQCRPIVTGNFLKNTEALSYFDYEVSGEMTNAEYIDANGLFVGNQQIDLRCQIEHLYQVISDLELSSRPK